VGEVVGRVKGEREVGVEIEWGGCLTRNRRSAYHLKPSRIELGRQPVVIYSKVAIGRRTDHSIFVEIVAWFWLSEVLRYLVNATMVENLQLRAVDVYGHPGMQGVQRWNVCGRNRRNFRFAATSYDASAVSPSKTGAGRAGLIKKLFRVAFR
jgi:hypothetical protein